MSKNPQNLKFFINLSNDSYVYYYENKNTFIIFDSIENEKFLIYPKLPQSIVSYNITKKSISHELKNAHQSRVQNLAHCFDKKKKIDLILSTSQNDNNIKIWNFQIWELILNIQDIFNINSIFNLTKNHENNIIVGCTELIKVFNLNGNLISTINEPHKFIDLYYDNKNNKNYILISKFGLVKSYDFEKNIQYYIYSKKDKAMHTSIVVNDNEDITKLIESNNYGKIRIWNFHTGEFLKIINGKEHILYLCLWDNEFIFAGCTDYSIKLINLKNGKIVKNLIGHKNYVLNIKKVIIPEYGECLISLGYINDEIKIWK